MVHEVGDLLFVAGQTSTRHGEPVARGRIGAEVSLEEGVQSAEQAMLNVLAVIHDATGDLRSWRPAKLTIFGAAAPDFVPLGQVANGASQLLADVYGPVYGRHARTTISMPNPANGCAVEIEAVFHRR